uniref:Uncharacterized protein n=1 Tax=Papio anubis TaxID=9555 RepID=A0A8I5NT82_PAPAN
MEKPSPTPFLQHHVCRGPRQGWYHRLHPRLGAAHHQGQERAPGCGRSQAEFPVIEALTGLPAPSALLLSSPPNYQRLKLPDGDPGMPRSPPCHLPPPAHPSDGDPGTPRNPPAISHLLPIPQGPRDTPKPPCRLPPPAHPSDGDPGTPQSPPAVSHLLPIPLLREQQGPGATPGVGQAGPQQ